MEKGKQRIWSIVIATLLLVTAGVVYITHRAIPFMMDDLWYLTKLSTDTPITNLSDIIESQVWHYHQWGGRSMTHGLLQVVLLMGETAADILNVLVMFALGFIICKVADVKGKYALLCGVFAAISMLLGLNANWKMSMFWQSGSVNYLYSTPLILLFLHCYFRRLQGDLGKKTMGNIFLGIAMVFLGVFVGWSNENMGPTAWILSLIVIYMVWKEEKKLPLWMIVGNIASLFGSVMCIAAPGNFVRSSQAPDSEYGLLWKLFLRGYGESKALLEFLYPTILILILMLILAKVMGITVGRVNWLLLLGALLSWGAMVLSPHYPDRATFGTMAFIICVMISLGKKIVGARKDLWLPLMGGAAFVWLAGMYRLGEFMAITWGWIR